MISDLAHWTLQESKEIGGSGIPSFAFIRNPWQWYVSRYNRAIEFSTFSDSFESYIHEASLGNKKLRMTDVWEHFTYPGVDRVGRYENLLLDLIKITWSFWKEIPLERFVLGLESRGKIRSSNYQHATYRDYYTPELVDIVHEMDEGLIDEYGYTWENVI